MIKIVDENFVKNCIRPRRVDSHKGENGRVMVVGGSWLYHGAPFLSAMASLRCGVDLAYIAAPEKIATAIRALSPNIIVLPLSDLKLTRGVAKRILKILPEIDSLVIGPGLASGGEAGIELVVKEAITLEKGVVLDATALYPEILKKISGGRVVLTPHAGEFKRVFGRDVPSELDKRVKLVKEEAERNRVTILLKGRFDVISDGVEVMVNETGTPAMTVGGTGDVLTGVIAALLAWGNDPFKAAASAAWINGKAGELASSKFGLHMLATDVIDALPEVLRRFDRIVK